MSATPQKNRTPRRVLAAAAGLATVGALVAAMPPGPMTGATGTVTATATSPVP